MLRCTDGSRSDVLSLCYQSIMQAAARWKWKYEIPCIGCMVWLWQHSPSASALSICTSSMQSELHTFFYLVYIQCCRRKDIVNKSDKLEKERPFATLFIIIYISGLSYICYNRKKRCKSFTERPTHTGNLFAWSKSTNSICTCNSMFCVGTWGAHPTRWCV
jgi:hypothetical protein